MGLLSGFIGGAAQAGGEILQRERESGVRRDEAQFASDLAERRERTLAELRNQYQIDSEGRARQSKLDDEARQISPEYIDRQVAAEGRKQKGLIQTRIELAPEAAKADRAAFDAGADTRKAAQDEKLRFSLDEYSQKSAAELEAAIKKLNDPKYLQGKAREAAAGRDPNSAALHRVQLETAQLALKEKQAEGKIPPAVKMMAEPAKKEMDLIAAAISKAQAENMFDATSDNGKALLSRHAEASRKLSDLLTPYLGDKAPKAPASGAMQDVRVGGKVIGQAATPEDAAALVKQFKSGGAPSAAPAVSGRPLYNAKQSDLQRMANKPRGVSMAEAKEAMAEIENRKGESRMSGN